VSSFIFFNFFLLIFIFSDIVAQNGQMLQVDGTSCSSPVFAGVVAQLNYYRLKAGKAVLGYANQLWYKAPASVFNDITQVNCNSFFFSHFILDFRETTTRPSRAPPVPALRPLPAGTHARAAARPTRPSSSNTSSRSREKNQKKKMRSLSEH
jgi:hypothetical protein